MEHALETRDLTKYYGPVRGIEKVNLTVEPGEIFGLLGPNGAGKTTTIRLLLDFIRPTSGSAQLMGLDSRSDSKEIRKRVGYLQGDFASYPDLTARQLAMYFGRLRGTGIGNAMAYMERLDLEPDRKFGVLSRGNRQKVGLVQALMSEPELLILDEPTSGLDPLMQHVNSGTVVDRAQVQRSHGVPFIPRPRRGRVRLRPRRHHPGRPHSRRREHRYA